MSSPVSGFARTATAHLAAFAGIAGFAGIAAGSLGVASAAAQTVHAASATAPSEAYSLLTATGALIGFGGAFSATIPAPTSPVVGVASTPDGHGAYAVEADGAVVALGDAVSHGSLAGIPLAAPVVGVAVTPDGGGYWMVASDGGIFSFGDARFFGSTGAIRLNKPVVGMAATPDGGGYWMVASDGGIFSFGDARFYGSTGAIQLNKPVVGMAAAPDGGGYWMVASDGGIFSFGDARFYGSTGAVHLAQPIISMSPTADGKGYWMVASDGGIFSFGDARFYGSAANLGTRIVGMATGARAPVTGAGGLYENPLRAVTGLSPERVDEGVDYGGAGPIYALGDGVVTSTSGSWPDGTFISYRLTDGPASGKLVYVAENVTPAVTVGQSVTPSTVVGVLHDAYPDMEIGWAHDSYGDTMAAVSGQWSSTDDANSIPTAYGANFNQLLVSLGAPSGILEHPNVTGTVAPGWPSW